MYQQAIWATKGIPCMLLLLQATPLSIGLALAGRFGCLCVEQEDVWFQGVCLSSPDADKEKPICLLAIMHTLVDAPLTKTLSLLFPVFAQWWPDRPLATLLNGGLLTNRIRLIHLPHQSDFVGLYIY